MKDIDSPSGIDLRPEPPNPVRLSKRAGIIGLVIVTAVLGLVGYGIATRRQRTAAALERSDPSKLSAASDAGKAIAAEVPARVISAAGPTPTPAEQLQVPEPPASANAIHSGAAYRQPYPPPVGPPPPVREPSPEEKALAAAYRQELEALAAPTATGGGFSGASRMAGGGGLPTREGDIEQMRALLQAMQGPAGQRGSVDLRSAAKGGAGGGLGGDSENGGYSDQNMQDQKAAFLAGARKESRGNDVRASRLRPLSKYEIKAGWDIPAVLEQALNSDLPGEIRALVRENVYDTASGNYLLIPQGSRLVGVYDSRIAYAQDAVTVVWNRVIFPDGSSIDLDGMAGQDAQGRAGLRHDVDNHYRRLIGFALLTSGFSAAFRLSQSSRGSVLGYPSATETAGSAVGSELSRLGADVTRRNLNVQPTIKVPVGFRFNVRVNRDLLFEGPYRPYRM
jgi:type IV secretion system protein VirB10